jgi:hypothetical protein
VVPTLKLRQVRHLRRSDVADLEDFVMPGAQIQHAMQLQLNLTVRLARLPRIKARARADPRPHW